MALIVQKYGGTSVGSVARIRAVAGQVHALVRAGNQVAVVVSAMGDSTDRLIELARELCPDPDAREMDVIANNLANANTAGFQGDKMLFREHLKQTAKPCHKERVFQQWQGVLQHNNSGVSVQR